MDLPAPPHPTLSPGERIEGRPGRQDNPLHATRGTHSDDVMLMLFLAGKGVYRLPDGEEVDVSAGMLGLVLPGPSVGILMADTDDPYDHFYCRFAGSEAIATARRISARALLRESTLSVAQVARRVGFGDAFYFSRVFKSAVGATPSKWRTGHTHRKPS